MNDHLSTRRAVLRRAFGLAVSGYVLPGYAKENVCATTNEDSEGPFYVKDAPLRSVIAGPEEPGKRTIVSGRVFGKDCNTPLSGALLDIWHADAKGNYHDANEQYRLRGRLRTDADGRYSFSSIKPPPYGPWVAELFGYFRPAHYHFKISQPGYVPLTTEIYFKGDPNLGINDLCQRGCHSDDQQRIIEFVSGDHNGQPVLLSTYDFVLRPV